MSDQRTHPTGPDQAGEESMAIAPPPPGGEEGEAASEGQLTGDEDHPAHHPGQQAGQDRSLRQRLRDDPQDLDAKIDVGSDESMDASDPPATSAPGHNQPIPSSGFKE